VREAYRGRRGGRGERTCGNFPIAWGVAAHHFQRDLDGQPARAGAAALYKADNGRATPARATTALQNAGNLNWNDADDPDPAKERRLNVDAL
jgi:hypothetical protein